LAGCADRYETPQRLRADSERLIADAEFRQTPYRSPPGTFEPSQARQQSLIQEVQIMSSIVWANISLAAVFIAAFIGIPLWMAFRRPDTAPDHSQAHAYLAAKASLATDAACSADAAGDDEAASRSSALHALAA
jgi:hypothetical protein